MSAKLKTNIKLNLTDHERRNLRKHKIRIREIPALTTVEIATILEVPTQRSKEIYALAEFQSIPSIGIKFTEDLIFLGFYSLNELKDKDGAMLLEAFEIKKGYWTDACVEDQFRLVVDYANNPTVTKKWWDYTAERKKHRSENGYPSDRPTTPWHELLELER